MFIANKNNNKKHNRREFGDCLPTIQSSVSLDLLQVTVVSLIQVTGGGKRISLYSLKRAVERDGIVFKSKWYCWE